MKTALLRLFKIRENEAYQIFVFFAFALCIQSGAAIGETVANSMFLIHIGVDKLPLIYMLTPFIILFFYIPLYSYFTKKYNEDIFFIYSLAALIITNVVIFLFIQNAELFLAKEYFSFIYYFLLLHATITLITLYTLLWNFIDRFFDIIDSKRVFSIFSAGTATGAIVGGISVSIFSQYFSADSLLIVWAIYNFLALVILLHINKKFKQIDDQEIEEEELPLVKQLLLMFRNLKSSTYVLVLFTVFFVSILLATILEFEYMNILSKDQSVESLALLFAKLYIFANIFNLFVNLFLFNRMVIRFGVKNVLLIQPIAYLIVFSYLSVEIGLSAGILGFFVIQGLLVSIDYNNQNFLYNGINSKIKYEVRTFIENLGEPTAIAVAGFFLFIVGSKLSISEISYIALVLSTAYLVLALILKYQYPKAMIENLKDDWLDLGGNEKILLENLDISEREEALIYADNKEHFVLAARFIYSYNAAKAISILLPFLNTCDKKHFQAGKELFLEILNSQDPEVSREIISWTDANEGNIHLRLKKELGAKGLLSSSKSLDDLEHHDPSRRAAAAVSILNSQYPQHFTMAIDTVYKLLKSSNAQDVIEGLFVLGKSRHTQYAFYAAEFLNQEDETLKLKALEAMYELSDHTLTRLVDPLLSLFNLGTKKERILILKILEKIQDTQSLLPLLTRSALLSAYEKREILSLVESMKLQAIPSLVSIVVDKKFSYSARSIGARGLGKLAFAQFKSLEKDLILNEIAVVYELLHFYQIINHEYEKSKNERLLLLAKYFMDKHVIVLEFILENLSIGGNLPSFELMKNSLRSSNAKNRANAIETIEQSTQKSIFTLLLPLLDQRNINEVMYFYKDNYEIQSADIKNILHLSLFSQREIEVQIAISLLVDFDENYLSHFRDKLLTGPDENIQKSLVQMIEEKKTPWLIQRFEQILKSKKMEGFTIFSLFLMLKKSELQDLSTGDELDPNALCILLEGECQDKSTYYEKGDLVGYETLFIHHDKVHKVKALAPVRILKLQKEAVINSIEVYPEIGLKFL